MKIKEEESELLKDTLVKCIENNIEIKVFRKTKKMYFGTFNYDNGKAELKFSLNNSLPYSLFWSAFTHESCHVDQYLEKSKSYVDYITHDFGGLDFPQCYFSGEMKNRKKAKSYFNSILKMELDCEKRALEKIKTFNLNIDPYRYIRQANLYMYYHVYMWDKQKELNGLDYESIKILENMPIKFLTLSEYWKTFKTLNIKWK